MESFDNTENLTEDQKYFIKYTAEAADKLSGSDLSDLVIELWNKKFNKATHKFTGSKYNGFRL